ncbi:MAG: hypothetical protein V3S05_07350 [Desulfobacterales bacterium]
MNKIYEFFDKILAPLGEEKPYLLGFKSFSFVDRSKGTDSI